MVQYQCEAWPAEAPTPAADPPLCSVFSIEIYARIMSPESFSSPTVFDQIMLPQSQLTRANTSWSAICRKLMEMRVPLDLHAPVIQKVVECARSAMSDNQDRNRNNIGIIVTLSPVVAVLEELRVEGCPRECVVCLEEMAVGSEASRLPCCHVFHQNCIAKWLRTRNLCPLCRFQMPT